MSAVIVQQIESPFGNVVPHNQKIIETDGITFVVEAGPKRLVSLLPSARYTVTNDLRRNAIPVCEGSGLLAEMKKEGHNVVTCESVDGALVHINLGFRKRRSLIERTLFPSKTMRMIDGTTTPALKRPARSLSHRIRAARRFLAMSR